MVFLLDEDLVPCLFIRGRPKVGNDFMNPPAEGAEHFCSPGGLMAKVERDKPGLIASHADNRGPRRLIQVLE